MNIVKCPNCERSLIFEEILEHECRKVVDYKIKGKTLWLFDGYDWYPRKLTNRKFTSRKSTSDYTEPFNNTLIKYSYRTIRYGRRFKIR